MVRAKSGETPVEASRDTNAQIVRYTCFMGAKDTSNNLTVGSLQRFTRRAGVEQLRQVKRMIRGIGNMLFSIYSLTKGFVGESVGPSENSSWANFAKQT